jgi:hypothetical protein
MGQKVGFHTLSTEVGVHALTTEQQRAAVDPVQTDIIKCAMCVGHEQACTHAVLAKLGVKAMRTWMHLPWMEYCLSSCEAYVGQGIVCLRKCLMLFG